MSWRPCLGRPWGRLGNRTCVKRPGTFGLNGDSGDDQELLREFRMETEQQQDSREGSNNLSGLRTDAASSISLAAEDGGGGQRLVLSISVTCEADDLSQEGRPHLLGLLSVQGFVGWWHSGKVSGSNPCRGGCLSVLRPQISIINMSPSLSLSVPLSLSPSLSPLCPPLCPPLSVSLCPPLSPSLSPSLSLSLDGE